MLDRFDFIRDMRLRGKPAVLGLVILGVLALSLLLFFLTGNSRVSRILYFPTQSGHRLVAEQRFVPRHRGIENDVTELAEGVLLGPTRHDAVRLFPRGGRVISAMVNGRTLYLDLSSQLLVDDPEAPLKGADALSALARTIRLNFPGLKQIVFLIDGQQPRFPKKI
ncbi:MAG TPA: GerMN domain-containing protein [Spirochaetia bacterium]